MIQRILTALLGDTNAKELKKLHPFVAKINAIETEYRKTLNKDQDFPAKTEEFKKRIAAGETIDAILPEAFALVKTACHRNLGKKWVVRGQEKEWDMVPFDVQLIGGMVLHHGKIAEMKTGEGKTLVCVMPAYLNALEGKGTWVVTVNDYLAQRDAEWMGGIYKFLGLSVNIAKHGQNKEEKQAAYNADITYGTNNEFGFDYLRDNMATRKEDLVQRALHYAIIDEVDSILIDEARTPLIISAPAEESTNKYMQYAQLITHLTPEMDYTIDEKHRAAAITETGIVKLEKLLGVENIYTEKGFEKVHHLEQALKAQAIFKKDIDYIVRDGEVMIVDEFTGRVLPGRRYSDGLHQAIEAKEGVAVKRESKTLATITFQNFFRLFKKIAGMTGTAVTEAEEFAKIYKLETMVIPTHKKVVRADKNDFIYRSVQGKFEAVAKLIKELYEKGQPVLVGTISIEKSEYLSTLLTRQGVPHNVLNAKQHEREAEIVAQAGQKGTVTIATNMAGRGTDIKLGEEVKDLGGLYIIGTERHESRRIDNQLRGRSGRQGDPGASQFYVSVEDDLMRLFGGDKIKRMMTVLNVPEDMPIENRLISNAIESSQRRVEGYNFDVRKHILEYDDVMNKHREIIYARRRKILTSDDIKNDILVLMERSGEHIVFNNIEGRGTREWDYATMIENIRSIHGQSAEPLAREDLEKITEKEDLIDKIKKYFWHEYAVKEEALPEGAPLRQLERNVYLRVIDTLWMEHITGMTHLRDAVALQGYGQKDPLVEYKQEAYRLFTKLMHDVQHNTLTTLFKLEIKKIEEGTAQKTLAPQAPKKMVTNESTIENVLSGEKRSPLQGPTVQKIAIAQETIHNETVGRNDPCPCGSGKKYKKCCGK